MIIFNGTDLERVAPVQIEDIDVSPIELNPIARQRAINWGAEFVRMSGGTRTITVTFALLEMDRAERETFMQKIRDFARVGNNKEYTLELPEYDDRHLECAVTQLPDYSYRKWWENKLKIIFTCFNNPYWTSNNLIEVQCGSVFSVSGSAPPLMNITWNVSATVANKAYSDGTNVMTFSTIPAGKMVIDLNRQTAAVGTTSIMRYYSPTGSWIKPKIGNNQKITGSGFVNYRERWV